MREQIPRKWALKAHDQRVVFVKSPNENGRHVIMKALLWALYLPFYPDMTVEVAIGDRYKPDLVALDAWGKPRFWGEAGQVDTGKIHSLCRRYHETHFVIAKWGQRIDLLAEVVQAADPRGHRRAPFDLITFPQDSLSRFFDADGQVQVQFDDLSWERITPTALT